MTPFLYYPVKDKINPTNPFGNPSPVYTALKQLGHPGIDFECPTGTPIYSPCDGTAVYATDSLGGDGIWIHTLSEGEYFNIILWHMPTPGTPLASQYPFKIPTNKTFVQVKAGQLLGYTDNSGFPGESDGPHLHFGVLPANEDWTAKKPSNGYLGCTNPVPFLNGFFAEDIGKPPVQPIPPPPVPVPTLPPDPTKSQIQIWLSALIIWLKSLQK